MASEYGEFCREQRERKRIVAQKRWERNYAQLAALADTHPDAQVLQLGTGDHWRVVAYGLTVDYYPTTGTYYELRGTIRGQRDHLHALLVYMKRESESRAHIQRARDKRHADAFLSETCVHCGHVNQYTTQRPACCQSCGKGTWGAPR